MFNIGMYSENIHQTNIHNSWTEYNHFTSLSLYNQIRHQSLIGRLVGWITHREHLEDLNELLASRKVSASYDAGLQTVAIAQIVGSEGRVHDFDSKFHPRKDNTSERWVGIAMAHLEGSSLPPVELIRIDDRYYVRDGHHRISVARAMGQTEIDAQVHVVELASERPSRNWEQAIGTACLAG
ncbi:MAG: hypothetical protein ACK2UW_01690 [Anaerolineales bacterium]